MLLQAMRWIRWSSESTTSQRVAFNSCLIMLRRVGGTTLLWCTLTECLLQSPLTFDALRSHTTTGSKSVHLSITPSFGHGASSEGSGTRRGNRPAPAPDGETAEGIESAPGATVFGSSSHALQCVEHRAKRSGQVPGRNDAAVGAEPRSVGSRMTGLDLESPGLGWEHTDDERASPGFRCSLPAPEVSWMRRSLVPHDVQPIQMSEVVVHFLR